MSKSEKRAYFLPFLLIHLVHFFKTFSTDSKSAWNSAFFDTHNELFNNKNFFCAFISTFCKLWLHMSRKRLKKKENLILWMWLRILSGNHQRVCITKLLKSLYPNEEGLGGIIGGLERLREAGEGGLVEARVVCGMMWEDGWGEMWIPGWGWGRTGSQRLFVECWGKMGKDLSNYGEAVNTWLRMGEAGLAEVWVGCGMLGGGWGWMWATTVRLWIPNWGWGRPGWQRFG